MSKVEDGRRLKNLPFLLGSRNCESMRVVHSVKRELLLDKPAHFSHSIHYCSLFDNTNSGRGKWKEIASMIPSRSTIQVKTHAQMVMKRVEAGEDIFDELRDLEPDQSSLAENCHDQGSCSMNTETSMKSPEVVMDSLRAFDTLTLRDQGAVLILYQMAKTM